MFLTHTDDREGDTDTEGTGKQTQGEPTLSSKESDADGMDTSKTPPHVACRRNCTLPLHGTRQPPRCRLNAKGLPTVLGTQYCNLGVRRNGNISNVILCTLSVSRSAGRGRCTQRRAPIRVHSTDRGTGARVLPRKCVDLPTSS